ncbi:MAG: MFS transporter [Janthinobacterium lividum]
MSEASVVAPSSGPAPAAGFPTLRLAYPALFVLALVGFVTNMDTQMTTLLLEPMKRDLGLSDVQIGLLQGTAYGIAYGLVAMPLGRLIDTRIRVRLMMAGVVVYALAIAACGLAQGIGLLLACRAVLGMVSALLVPAAISLLADLFPPARRTIATSLFVVGQVCGATVGILAGGLVFDFVARLVASDTARLGGIAPWRVLYFGAAAACLILLPLLASVREPERQERDAEARSTLSALRELWAYRCFVAPVVAGLLFSTVALTAPTVWAAPLLIRNFGLTPGGFAGWFSAVTLVGSILGTLAVGPLAELGRRRCGPRGVLLPALVAVLAAAPLACFGLAPSVPLFAAMLGLSLFCFGLVQTAGVLAFTLNLPNEVRGLGLGVYTLVAALLGTATAPAVIALVSRALGGEAMLGEAIAVVSAPSAILSALFFGLAMRGRATRRVN